MASYRCYAIQAGGTLLRTNSNGDEGQGAERHHDPIATWKIAAVGNEMKEKLRWIIVPPQELALCFKTS
ncbi:hypothetical protein BDV95DRAFT_254463 [Massariosphaeria phaeospora]|uniref:Uncharacterized protein n=1 Tax=Massariosphaeria phaeospora TaxID=100035 RepID=A0A7C8M1R6_9PLEO|nr:hypothetical protein BDV95DRAFT_254463 [Massariosphaeria phaeospora]